MMEVKCISVLQKGINQSTSLFIVGPPEVWVIGSSIIRDAYYYAIENKAHNLGLDLKIVWDFRSGMKVQHLANTIQHLALKYMKYPDMLIIHCGGNDIG
jgi:hypothetical protein